jgi:hypothetical protein
VEVTSLKTETAQFFANPGGTMTMKQSIVPLRIKRDGGWADIDPTLVKREDGSFTPKAITPEVVFSAGGTQPFARMTTGGTEIALSWPRPLPPPVVSGDTATYAEVMPGVDLRARAGREGFGHELVVKTREAAAAIEKVSFGLTAKGVTMSTDEKGALKAVNAKGETVFSAPAASMWDSAERKAAVGVAVNKTELALTPDRALLTDPTAKLPITIDPQYSYHTVRQNGWTLVRSGWAGNSHWNMGPEDERAENYGVARVGVSPESGNGSVDRSLFRFDTAPLAGTVINTASFHIKQGWKYAHTCNAEQTPWLDLYLTGDIGPHTTWNNQPGWNNHIGSARPVYKLGQSCGPNWVDFPLKDWMQLTANNGWANLNLGLRDRDENNISGWKRFYVQNEPTGVESYPHIKVEYNHYPGNAVEHATDPVLTSCKHCGGKSYVAGDRIILKGRMSDADGGNLQGGILVYGPGLPSTGKWLDAGNLNAGSVFSAALDLSEFKDGDTYTWEMWAWDGALESRQKTAGPPFTIDRTAPVSPAVDSVLYQSDNDWHGGLGVADKFWFKANGPDDVDHYLYSWTDPPNISVPLDDSNTLGGHASVWLAPSRTGASQVLFVSSVDRAGNKSDPTQYRFNVRTDLGPKALWPLDGHSRDDAEVGDRDATLHSGATFTDAGAVGSAVQLDGVNGHLTAPHTVLTGTSFSVSAWVKLDPQHPGFNATAVSQLSSQLSSALPGFQLSWLGNNSWGFGIARSATDVNNDFAFSPIGAPQPGAWTHLTGVYDDSVRTLRLYVNGALVGSAQRGSDNWNPYGEVRIGDAGSSAVQRWKGSVDEVRVHDRALVGNEVRALVGLGNVQAGQWRFDEEKGTTAGNNIPGGTPMTLRSGAKFAPGAVGRGLQLDGVDDSAQTGESVLRTDQSFAVTAWVKQDKDVPDGYAFVALSQDSPSKSGFYLNYRQVDGAGRWELHAPADDSTPGVPGAFVRSSMTAKTNTWTHLAGVFDRTGEQITLYVNGVHAGTVPWKSFHVSSGSLVVGRGKWDGNPASYWPGGVDEVRAYSRVLDEAEIRGIIAADNVATGSWKLDGNANDDSGSSRNGTAKGNPSWVPGHSTTPNADDLAVGLDGVDDHISAPNAIDTARSYAISAWVKPEAANVAQTAVSQDGAFAGTAERSAFAVHATADGKWAVTGISGNTTPTSATGGSVQAGAWTHLAAVHDVERKELSLYVNGVIAGTKPFEDPWISTKELQIGRGQAAGKAAEFFQGAIDDVRAYQRILFEDEIRIIAGRDLTLVHNLKTDETGGTTAADSVGARGGTLHGGATFQPGRSGNAVQLDGVDDAVSTTGIDLRTDQSFTVTAWVNLRKTNDGEVTAVSLDSGQSGKFRLGHIKDRFDNSRGAWIFEMPEQNGSIPKAALSTLETEVGDDKWTHLVGVYDAKAKKIWLYVNGLRAGDGTLRTPWAGGEGLQLGRSKHNNTYSRHWLGRIDDVRVYTGALSGDRVWELRKSYGA